MKTNKFLKLSKVKKLDNSELQNVKGGKEIIQIYSIKPIILYGVIPTEDK